MATAETDLDKPSLVKCTLRKVGIIIHPSRFVRVKSTTWPYKIFGSYETYIGAGDVSKEASIDDINNFILKEKVRILSNE